LIHKSLNARRERFAFGEIDKDEYDRTKRPLRAQFFIGPSVMFKKDG